MEKTRKNKGITLIALTITIIVLLILSGISIQIINQTGVLHRAEKAKALTKEAQNKENITLAEYENTITQTLEGTTRDSNSITFRQIVTLNWELTGFSGYINNISMGEKKIDISKYNFQKEPYAIVKGTRALTAYIDQITTSSLNINWQAAWGSDLGSGFGMVEILLIEPN